MRTVRRSSLLAARLRSHSLIASAVRKPEAIVHSLGAVQSQDYQGAAWALGLRGVGITAADVDRAFDDGRILRTHVLRPTWHFVAPADIRWMLALSAPRVHAVGAAYHRQYGNTPTLLARALRVFQRALEGGRFLTRQELAAALTHAGMAATGTRLALIVMFAELEGLLCSGPRRGKQFTYALLDERVAGTPALLRAEALARLTDRYFTSHGPATVRDFAWWSGLTHKDAREGIAAMALSAIECEGLVLYDAGRAPMDRCPPSTFLLPNFDEFIVAYQDRRFSISGIQEPRQILTHQIVVDGQVAGSWTRTIRPKAAEVTVRFGSGTTGRLASRLRSAADRLAAFLERPVALASSDASQRKR